MINISLCSLKYICNNNYNLNIIFYNIKKLLKKIVIIIYFSSSDYFTLFKLNIKKDFIFQTIKI